MPTVSVTLRPRGLHPLQAAKAWHLHKEEELPLTAVRCEVVNIQGLTPSVKAVWTAIQQVERSKEGVAIPRSGYHRCGRRPKLSKVPGLGDIHHRQAGPAMPGRATGPAGARPG